jgi:hypothetical protein
MATEKQVRQVLELRAAGRPVRSIADELGLAKSTAIAIANGTHCRHLAQDLPRFISGKSFYVDSKPELANIEERREKIVVHVLSLLGMPWREISISCPIPISKEYARRIAYGRLHVRIAPHMKRLTPDRLAIAAGCSGCKFYHNKKPDSSCDLGIPELSPKHCGSFFPN